jgi:hypothetical protein
VSEYEAYNNVIAHERARLAPLVNAESDAMERYRRSPRNLALRDAYYAAQTQVNYQREFIARLVRHRDGVASPILP